MGAVTRSQTRPQQAVNFVLSKPGGIYAPPAPLVSRSCARCAERNRASLKHQYFLRSSK